MLKLFRQILEEEKQRIKVVSTSEVANDNTEEETDARKSDIESAQGSEELDSNEDVVDASTSEVTADNKEDLEMEIESENTELSSEPILSEEEMINRSYSDTFNDVINKVWETIAALNSIIATINFKDDMENDDDAKKEREGVINILEETIDEATIQIGMLQKASTFFNTKREDLLTDGENKAEEIVDKTK